MALRRYDELEKARRILMTERSTEIDMMMGRSCKKGGGKAVKTIKR